jgi:F0F1-type ATP synthase epsilon subunit
MEKKAKFNLLVRSRDGVVFRGDVDSITSFNETGEFDVLPEHANFISLIQKQIVIRDLKGEVRRIEISNALMRVRENFVEVYLGVEGIMTEQFEKSHQVKQTEEAPLRNR